VAIADHRADDVNPPPRSGELFRIPGMNRNRQHRHGDDSENDRRRNTVKWKEKSGHGCCDGGDEKPFRPTVRTIAKEHGTQNDETAENRGKTDKRVDGCVDVQDHGTLIHQYPVTGRHV
jgi:hypothetical protein